MSWRLRDSVVRGKIDNRVPGTIIGKIWLLGRDEPIVLNLKGNGFRDVAGSLFVFENRNPQQSDDEPTDLFAEQTGSIGDFTASRKVRAFDIPNDEALALIRRGESPPEHMANGLYLEWFSERNGRVVIESCDYELRIVDTVWSLDSEEETRQLDINTESMAEFMKQLSNAIITAEKCDQTINELGIDIDESMDEFQWERFLKESDKRVEMYGELLDRYSNHPDRDNIVAREMGWDRLPDVLDAYAETVQRGEIEAIDIDDVLENPVPNPLTEGVDWVRDEFGDPVHPLQKRITESVMTLWHECQNAGLLDMDVFEEDVHNLLFKGRCIGAKLAGALNGMAYGHETDSGFVIASLKRTLPCFDQMMSALDEIRGQTLIAPDRLQRFSDDMFGIREELIKLMERFRKRV